MTFRQPTSKLDPEQKCCAPKCKREWVTRIGPLPVCEPHRISVERHLAMVWQTWDIHSDWRTAYRKAERRERSRARQQLERERRGEWVYFIMIDDLLKIGYSSSIKTRIRTFAAYGQSVKVVSIEPANRAHEQALHRRFAEHRASGVLSREMFYPAQEILDYIANERECIECDGVALVDRVVCQDHSDMVVPEEDLIGRAIAHDSDEVAS